MGYLNLKAEMAKRSVTIESISKTLNLHRNSVSNKLNGKNNFTIEEAFSIKKKFFPDISLEYLFSKTLDRQAC